MKNSITPIYCLHIKRLCSVPMELVSISSGFYCENCVISIERVAWKQQSTIVNIEITSGTAIMKLNTNTDRGNHLGDKGKSLIMRMLSSVKKINRKTWMIYKMRLFLLHECHMSEFILGFSSAYHFWIFFRYSNKRLCCNFSRVVFSFEKDFQMILAYL